LDARCRHHVKSLGKAALIIAHPGHELLVHGWLEAARPLVFVLTDGSGRTGHTRLDSSRRVLAAAGAQAAELFGAWTDRQLYDTILHVDAPFFVVLAQRLATALDEAATDYVVGDAAEGYSPAHDICRAVIDTAVALLHRRGKTIGNYDFVLEARPARSGWRRLCLALDRAAMQRKLAAAEAYPELASEVQRLLDSHGVRAFRHECLRPVPAACRAPQAAQAPFYEGYGARQVAAGHYRQVLRYREHMVPLLAALRQHVEETKACPLSRC
jgi:hypothetical protein